MYGDYSGDTDEKCWHRDHYDTKTDAKRAAKQMGISGCHSQKCNGKRVYMPGDSHQQYMDAKGGSLFSGGSNGAGIDPETFGL